MAKEQAEKDERPICGMVMPISGIPPRDSEHWQEVRIILDRAISNSGMTPQPVWEGGAADIIHDRIIRNLYENPLIVCDVSGLNPNVMLEVGIRLSFGKPTILVTDDISTLPFDTKVIDHLQYPTGLHLLQTEQFMEQLSAKIRSVMEAAANDTYRPFIKNFGRIDPGTLGTDKDTADIILSRLDSLSAEVRQLPRPRGALSGAATNALLGLGENNTFYTISLTVARKDISRAESIISGISGVHRIIKTNNITLAVQLRTDVLWKQTQEKILAALTYEKVDFQLSGASIQTSAESLA